MLRPFLPRFTLAVPAAHQRIWGRSLTDYAAKYSEKLGKVAQRCVYFFSLGESHGRFPTPQTTKKRHQRRRAAHTFTGTGTRIGSTTGVGSRGTRSRTSTEARKRRATNICVERSTPSHVCAQGQSSYQSTVHKIFFFTPH